MRDTERLWADFLGFCGTRDPDDWLALDFVQFATADLNEPMRTRRAEQDLQLLQVMLTWRRKRARRTPGATLRPPGLRLRQTG